MRKLVNFARRERPAVASQMSECLGAGTGCGWCIPILKRIHAGVMSDAAPDENGLATDLPATADEYAAGRQDYIRTQQPKNKF